MVLFLCNHLKDRYFISQQIHNQVKKLLLAYVITLLSFGAKAQEIPAWTANDIMRCAMSKDTVYVINFWATWCGPCVGELPEFNRLMDRYATQPVKIILVSLDFKEEYPDKLAWFVKRKKLKPQVVWLRDTDPNQFMPKISKSWQGSIPATLLVSPGKGEETFIEGIISERKIRPMIDKML
jgi:thiol-disulfide isomerase/thioredoxin